MAKRRKLTRAQKARLFHAHNGQCAECGSKIEAGEVEWDHIKERRMAVDETDAAEREQLANFQPLCPTCHGAKTAEWSGIHAKAKRQAGETGQRARRERAKAEGRYRAIPNPENPWPPKGARKLRSRGFQ
jgi:5-methylcytosine-specific restriction endonuclease McrA